MAAKNKGGSNTTTSVKKQPNIISQKIKKAQRCLQSGGKRGLDRFLEKNSDIKNNAEIKRLLAKAEQLRVRPVKGKRGPCDPNRRQKGQSSYPNIKTMREDYNRDPEKVEARVEADAASEAVTT